MENKRSEYISMWVTPEVKKEFEFSKDNPEMQENIIRRYIKSEVDFLENEMKGIDEYTIRYKAKLIGIKDSFEKSQDSYIEELEKIYKNTEIALKKVSDKTKNVQGFINDVNYQIKDLIKSLDSVNTYKLESLLDILDRFNNTSKDQKDLLKLLLKEK